MKPEKVVCHNEEFDKRIVLHNIIKKYENHFSIIKIKNNMSVKSHFSSNNTLASGRQVTSDEVSLILKSITTKRASSSDKIQIKPVKLAAHFLSTLIAKAINKRLASSKFHDS